MGVSMRQEARRLVGEQLEQKRRDLVAEQKRILEEAARREASIREHATKAATAALERDVMVRQLEQTIGTALVQLIDCNGLSVEEAAELSQISAKEAARLRREAAREHHTAESPAAAT